MSQQLVKAEPQGLAVDTTADWELMHKQAVVLHKSGLLPTSIKSPEAVMAIVLIGRELNIPMMTALNNINVIAGKPTIPPQLMLAMINRTGELEQSKLWDEGETAFFTLKRRGREAYTASFSMEDARQFKTSEGYGDQKRTISLSEKHNWKSQPRIMRQWRAIAACARVVFPDVVLGLYTPDEMGARVNEDGELDSEPKPEPVEEKPKRAARKPAPTNGTPQVEASAAEPSTDETAGVGVGSDDPLAGIENTENAAIEAQRAQIIAEIKSLSGASDEEFEAWANGPKIDLYNRTIMRLRETLETLKAKLAARQQPKSSEPASSPTSVNDEGARKVLRKDGEGNLVGVWEGSYMTGTAMTEGDDFKRMMQWVEYWRSHPWQGQDLATIKAKVVRVISREFHDWKDLDAAEVAKAARTLQEWRPDLEKPKAEGKGKK